jgi:hypothetical protein
MNFYACVSDTSMWRSSINLYPRRWTKPPAGDVDAIEALGNPGWNWAEYLKYTRISET